MSYDKFNDPSVVDLEKAELFSALKALRRREQKVRKVITINEKRDSNKRDPYQLNLSLQEIQGLIKEVEAELKPKIVVSNDA